MTYREDCSLESDKDEIAVPVVLAGGRMGRFSLGEGAALSGHNQIKF